MGIVVLASGAEQPSLTGSSVGELAVKAAASPADDPLGGPTARMRMHLITAEGDTASAGALNAAPVIGGMRVKSRQA